MERIMQKMTDAKSAIEKYARAAMKKHQLFPLEKPMGDGHHTDAKFTREDEEIGELAYWLGHLFADKDNYFPGTKTTWYLETSSSDIWMRVARALRVHGLKITNRD
jgi:hypothetical protein